MLWYVTEIVLCSGISEIRYPHGAVLWFKGAGGGLHQNSLEIDFIVVSDRGE